MDELYDINNVGLYSVYDTLAERYGPVYQAVNDAVATRMYYDVMRSIQVEWRTEYELYCLGKYDLYNGVINPNLRQIFVSLSSLKEEERKEEVNHGKC